MLRNNNLKVLQYINANEDLTEYFKYYINHNTSFDNPYHNINHTFEMMYHIINIFENSEKYEYSISQTDLYYLLISALFHDFNHSKGLYTDEINVYNAKLGLKDAVESYILKDMTKSNIQFSEKVIEECSKIIDATQYPYIIPDAELTFLQRIIRECDILVTLYDDFFTQTLMGLKSEMQGKNFKELLANEVQFLINSYKELKLQYSLDLVSNHAESIFELLDVTAQIIK